MKRRTRVEIILSILENSVEGASKTKIVYGSNLNFNLASRYLSLLLEKDLISVDAGEKRIYRTTEKGVKFLRKGREVLTEIEPEILPKMI